MDEKQRDKEDGKPIWQASGHERQVDADAYHIWTPRPLIRSVYWRPEPEPPREAVAGSYEVFLDQRVFAAMHEHVWSAAVDRSQFGYLIGDLCEDPSASRRFVIITSAAPSRFPFLEAGPEQIPAEASVALQLEVERRRGVLVGWYHSHPRGGARLSPEDVATHEQLFPESWQVAFLFVTDPYVPAGACFRRTPEGFDGEMQLPFYEMVTNESLLAKGVRRSRVDWANVSTLDTIRLEPPPRPEPPPGPAPPAIEPASDFPTQEPSADTSSTPVAMEQAHEEKPVATSEAVSVDESESVADEASAEIPPRESPKPAGVDLAGGYGDSVPVEARESTGIDHDSGGFQLDEDDLDAFQVVSADAGVPEPAGDDDFDDLDLDSLIAEVEGAGLSEDDGAGTASLEVEVSGPEALEGDEEETEPESGPEQIPELPADERPASEPPSAGASTAGPELEVETDPLVAIESELTSSPPVEAAVRPGASINRAEVVAPTVPPAEVPESASVPEPGRRIRNWILVAAGIVICIGVVGVLALVLFKDTEEDSGEGVNEAPAAVELPATSPAITDPRDSIGVVEPPPAVTPAVSSEELEELSNKVLASISTYYGRDGAFSSGEIGCSELQSSFLEVMDSWIDYSMRGKAGWQGRLPPELEDRDERLYLGVQDVERLFEASSCPRP